MKIVQNTANIRSIYSFPRVKPQGTVEIQQDLRGMQAAREK
jgi:hypothetical protein